MYVVVVVVVVVVVRVVVVVEEPVEVEIEPHIARLANTQFLKPSSSHPCELEFLSRTENTSWENVHFSLPIHSSIMMLPASRLHGPPWYPPVHDPTGFPMLANPTSLISCPNSHSSTILLPFPPPLGPRRNPSSIQVYVSGMS